MAKKRYKRKIYTKKEPKIQEKPTIYTITKYKKDQRLKDIKRTIEAQKRQKKSHNNSFSLSSRTQRTQGRQSRKIKKESLGQN